MAEKHFNPATREGRAAGNVIGLGARKQGQSEA
jgi:hypothetical protein